MQEVATAKIRGGTGIKTLETLRFGVFICFWMLSLRFLAVYLYHAPDTMLILGIGAVVGIIIISWWRIRWSLYAFIVGIPLVSGLQVTGYIMPAPLLSFSFAAIYFSWFLKTLVWNRGEISPRSVIDNLVDILAALVIISLLMSFQPYPVGFILRRICALSVLAQKDVFWGINASYILLQGLFFYRILVIEMGSQKYQGIVVSILYAQAATIILFSSLHLLLHVPANFHYGTFGIFSPFNDAHSYGSYIAFLLFVFLSLMRTSNGRQKTIAMIFVCFLAVFIAFSGSRITWITVALIGIPFLLYVLGKRGRIVLISAIVIPLILINLFPGAFQRSDNGYLKRLSTVVLFKGYVTKDLNVNLEGRLAWWTRALCIIGEQPATGIGIGSFYRASPLYHGKGCDQRADSHENAHNYYLQLATELGVPGLLIFLCILFFTLKAGFLAVARHGSSEKGLISGLIFGLSAYLITMLTGHPLLLSNQQFLFWTVVAFLVSFYRSSGGGDLWAGVHRYYYILIGLLVLVTIFGYVHRIYGKSVLSESYEYGFYEYEKLSGEEMRWTMMNSATRITATSPLMKIKVFAAPYNIGGQGLSVDLAANGVLLERVGFKETGTKTLYYSIPSLKGKTVDIKICTSRTFNPFRMGLTKDIRKNRQQGVAVAIGFCREKERPGSGEKGAIGKRPAKRGQGQ